MIKQKCYVGIGLSMGYFVLFMAVAGASEPQMPNVNRTFDVKKEEKIVSISNLSSKEAFERFKDLDFLVDEDYLYKAIFKTFRHKKEEAVFLSLQNLFLPEKKIMNGKLEIRAHDLYIAKKILEVFPQESVPSLLITFKSGDAITRGNVIRSAGQIPGPAVKNMLVDALDDKEVCEPEDTEIEGQPMRVCDLAYNQLVLRYRIKNVLRTISPNFNIETREFHIAILKGKL